MKAQECFARSKRRRQLHGRDVGGGLLVVALDHSFTDGPPARGRTIDELVGEVCTNGADAVVLHKGSLRFVRPQWFDSSSVIVHLSGGTTRAPDPNARCLVATVEEALRLGADAVSAHVNLGSASEQRQLADLALVGEACDRWNLPLLAMMYPRGEQVLNPRDPELIAHAVSIAADLGADLVKTLYPGNARAFADITRDAPVPILTAGGPPRPTLNDLLAEVQDVLHAGAGGVVVGRNIFTADQPGAVTRKLADLVHGQEQSS
jgi:2-amino-4,5-dihydroxy-6-oxo-7-(phosphonooxy)heptanoate synthase